MPVWRQAAQREKEAELVWRGQQYDRALQLYRRKASAPGAPNLDILIEQKFLRKKYKDPITGGDFELRPVVRSVRARRCPACPVRGTCDRASVIGRQALAVRPRGVWQPVWRQSARPGNAHAGRRAGTTARDSRRNRTSSPFGSQPFGRTAQGAGQEQSAVGGQPHGQLIGGVRSKSKATSIRRAERTHALRSMGVRATAVQPEPAGAAARRDERHRDSTAQRPASTRARAASHRAAARRRRRSGRARGRSHDPVRCTSADSSTAASCTRGRSAARRGLSRDGCTRLVSSTT